MTCKNLIYHLGIFILLLSACSNQADREDQDTAGYIPQAPDYADSRMWYTRENNQVEQGADVFYIVSTWEKDWTTQPTAASATMPTCITLNIVPTWTRRFPVSPEHHVLVLDGYSGSEYHPILGFLNVGDFHGCEPWLYQESLHENITGKKMADNPVFLLQKQ